MPSIGSAIQTTPVALAMSSPSSPRNPSSGRAPSSRARISSSDAMSTAVTTSVGLDLVSATSTPGRTRRHQPAGLARRSPRPASAVRGRRSYGLLASRPVARPRSAAGRGDWGSSRPAQTSQVGPRSPVKARTGDSPRSASGALERAGRAPSRRSRVGAWRSRHGRSAGRARRPSPQPRCRGRRRPPCGRRRSRWAPVRRRSCRRRPAR